MDTGDVDGEALVEAIMDPCSTIVGVTVACRSGGGKDGEVVSGDWVGVADNEAPGVTAWQPTRQARVNTTRMNKRHFIAARL